MPGSVFDRIIWEYKDLAYLFWKGHRKIFRGTEDALERSRKDHLWFLSLTKLKTSGQGLLEWAAEASGLLYTFYTCVCTSNCFQKILVHNISQSLQVSVNMREDLCHTLPVDMICFKTHDLEINPTTSSLEHESEILFLISITITCDSCASSPTPCKSSSRVLRGFEI